MNVVFCHYHLNRGGVTSVIVNQLYALNEMACNSESDFDVLLLHGGRTQNWDFDLQQKVPQIKIYLRKVDGLDYSEHINKITPRKLTKNFINAIETYFGNNSKPLIHIHNHILGKNIALIETVKTLAKSGYPIVAQIHDFSEDGRPENYAKIISDFGSPEKAMGELYLDMENVIYLTINQRDFNILPYTGLDYSKIGLLHNPVVELKPLANRNDVRSKISIKMESQGINPLKDDDRLVLYPVRGIRRKNIGEAILLSLLVPNKIRMGITLKPLNRKELIPYEVWVKFVIDNQLPFAFDLAENLNEFSYADILNSADAVITTSVAEGFGMVFLEPWILGVPVTGRLLPEITKDFTETGIAYPGSYTKLMVPLHLFNYESFCGRFINTTKEIYKSYGYDIQESKIIEFLSKETIDNEIDFGKLDILSQKEIVENCLLKRARKDIFASNPGIFDISKVLLNHDDKIIEVNQNIIKANFSVKTHGTKLLHFYKKVLKGHNPVKDHKRNQKHFIDAFLDLPRIKMLIG